MDRLIPSWADSSWLLADRAAGRHWFDHGAGGSLVQTRIFGGLAFLWGAFLIVHAYRDRGHGALDVAQGFSVLLAAVFVVMGHYSVFKGPDRSDDTLKDQPNT